MFQQFIFVNGTYSNCLVFRKIFNFLGQIPASIQALDHSCLPILDLLGHVIHFLMSNCTDLIETNFKFLHTFFSIYCSMLTSFGKNMPKTCSLETFFQSQDIIIDDYFKSHSHGIKVCTFIFHINDDFFP